MALAQGEYLEPISTNLKVIVNEDGDMLGFQSQTSRGRDFRGNSTPIVNDLTTGGPDFALSADQGVILKNLIDAGGGGGGGTNTVIDGGGPGVNYGGSLPINGGGPGATYG